MSKVFRITFDKIPLDSIKLKQDIVIQQSTPEHRLRVENLAEDSERRSISTIRDNVLPVRWIALEDLINVLYKNFEHKDKKETLEFFKERNLYHTENSTC